MNNSRKKLLAQIKIMDRKIHSQQSMARLYKKDVKESKFNNRPLIALSILLPSLWLGWRIGRGRMLGSVTKHLTEVGLLAASSYFQKQVMDIFKKN